MQESNVQLEETTAKLQQEKRRLDTLLVRQYNLLAVLGSRSGGHSAKQKGNKDAGSISADSQSGCREGLTLGKSVKTFATCQVCCLQRVESLRLLYKGFATSLLQLSFRLIYRSAEHGIIS